MPFVALNKFTQERVDITRHENPRHELRMGELICPLCEQELVLVAGSVKRKHFRHKVDCTSDYARHPESPEHLAAKYDLVMNLRANMAEYTDAEIEFEVRIPEIRRIADVLVTFPMGWRLAHEIQLSPITIEELEQRTNDYLAAGIDVVWWLGRHANTHQNKLWSEGRFGVANEVFVNR